MNETSQSALRPRLALAVQIAVVLLATALVVVLMGNRIYSKSGDLALHYAWADEIARNWTWPVGDRPSTIEIRPYPAIAHYMAAILGVAMGSTFWAMSLIATLSVFACYYMFAKAISAGSAIGTIIAAAVCFPLFCLARTQYAIEGFEVYYNFFYAQMVGEVVFLAYVYWMTTTRHDWRVRLAVSFIIVYVAAWLYILTSVEILLAYYCLEGFYFLRPIVESRRLRFRIKDLLPMAAGIVLPIVLVTHPQFRTMIGIAANNGALDIHWFNHLVPRFSLALLVLGGALGVLAPATPRWRAGALFLATAGCATAIAALLQFISLRYLKAGSDYAVNKYSYSVFTLFFLCVGAAVAALVEHGRPVRPARTLAVLAPAGLAIFAAFATPVEGFDRVDRFARYERYMKAVMTSKELPQDTAEKTASRNHAFGWALNHAATLGDLYMEFNQSIGAIAPELDSSQVGPEKYAFLDMATASAKEKECVVPNTHYTKGDVSLVSMSCAHPLPPVSVGQNIVLASLSAKPAYFWSGWSVKEPTGVWTGQESASMAMHLDHTPQKLKVGFDVTAFIPRPGYVQHVHVSVGGAPIADWTFDADRAPTHQSFTIPASLIKDNNLKLDFSLPNATSPFSQKVGLDARELGIFVSAFSLSE